MSSFYSKVVYSKCHILKTSSRTVSIQVQLVKYKCQPGHKLFRDQCQTNGQEDLIGSECQYRHKQALKRSMPNQWAQSHWL